MTIDGYGYRHYVCWTCMRNAYCLGKCKMTQWTNMDGLRYEIVFGIYFLEFNAGFGCNFDFGFNICFKFCSASFALLVKAHEFTFFETFHLWCRVFLWFRLCFLRFLRFRLFFPSMFPRYRADTINLIFPIPSRYYRLHLPSFDCIYLFLAAPSPSM